MVAVVDGGFSPPDQQRSSSVLHRLVAVALRPEELRAGADLVLRLNGVARVDLLFVTDGDDPDGPDEDDDDLGDEDDERPAPHDRGADVATVVRGRAAELGLMIEIHRLGLPLPVTVRARDVDDVVAAISELVGFDPEPGVACVVPLGVSREVHLPGTADGPADAMVGRAVERVVAAYGLPLVTYLPVAP